EAAYIRLVYKMKHSIRSLELQRKIILIARQTDQRSRIGQRHGDQPATRIEILVRIDNHSTHFIGADSSSVHSQVRPIKSALSVDHMTLRASGCAMKQCFSPRSVSRKRRLLAAALQHP